MFWAFLASGSKRRVRRACMDMQKARLGARDLVDWNIPPHHSSPPSDVGSPMYFQTRSGMPVGASLTAPHSGFLGSAEGGLASAPVPYACGELRLPKKKKKKKDAQSGVGSRWSAALVPVLDVTDLGLRRTLVRGARTGRRTRASATTCTKYQLPAADVGLGQTRRPAGELREALGCPRHNMR